MARRLAGSLVAAEECMAGAMNDEAKKAAAHPPP